MKVYIGYDQKQRDASEVCKYSIQKNSSKYIEVVDLKKDILIKNELYYRPDGDPSSTDFTYTRFLVPYLSNYSGWSMFCDNDFVFTDDIYSIMDDIMWDPEVNNRAVYVVKQPEYVPASDTKFYGEQQLSFPRKNWSSFMLFNNSHPACKKLNPFSVSNQSPQWLHRFEWCSDHNIGGLAPDWNFLVGDHEFDDYYIPRGIHFTNGGPFNGVWGQDYEEIWLNEWDEFTGLAFPGGSMDLKI